MNISTCPFCNQKFTNYQAHMVAHREFFKNKNIDLPETIESFNERLAALGFRIQSDLVGSIKI